MEKISTKFAAIFLVFAAISASQSGTATRIYTIPGGLAFNVDGQRFTGSAAALWPVGTKHVLDALPSQFGGLNVKSRYTFGGWHYAGGVLTGGASVTITADPAFNEFYAAYSVEHALDVVFTNCTGTPECPTPGTIYINGAAYTQTTELYLTAGSVVTLIAQPADGFVFDGWDQGDNQSIQGFLNTITMDTPSIVRPHFSPAKRVTVATIPDGLGVYADRALVTGPTAFDWRFNSIHVLGAPSPQMDHYGAWWVFSKWSDDGPLNHTMTVPAGGPTITVTATFVPVTVTDLKTNPQGLALKVDGRDNWPNYYFPWAAGEVHRIEAPAQQTDQQGRLYAFASWSNGGARAQDYTVPPSDAPGGTVRVTANYTPVGRLLVSSAVAGLTIQVDGADCATPCEVVKPLGTRVKLSAPASLPIADNARADFDGWPGSGSLSGEWAVTLGQDPVLPNLTYHRMNRLVAASNPADAATWRLDPASPDGYFDANATVRITVAPQPGFRFRRWDGDAAGSMPVASVAMNAPRLVEAVLDRVPFISPPGVINAAGSTPVAAVAPASIASVFGASFTPETIVGPSGPLAQSLGCVTVRLADRMLPLFFISPSQINFQMPDDVAPGDQQVVVSCDGLPDAPATVTVARNAPGLFQDANGGGVIMHEDGSAVTADSPAKRGELLTIYGTGFGPTDRTRPFGFPLPADPVYSMVDAVTVRAGDVDIAAQSAFGAPGRIGVDAAQFRLPDGTPSGRLQLKLSVNGKDSNTVVAPVE